MTSVRLHTYSVKPECRLQDLFDELPNLGESLTENRPRALIQMATGSGKIADPGEAAATISEKFQTL